MSRNMGAWWCVLGCLGGCTEYQVGKQLTTDTASPGTEQSTVDTLSTPTPPTNTPTHTGDTGSSAPGTTATTGACYASEFGYEVSPAARLVTTDGVVPITVTLTLWDSAHSNRLVLDAPDAVPLIDSWAVPTGTAVQVGPYPTGSELTFAIDVLNTGDHWQSGPASRNADGVAHVAVRYDGNCVWTMGFEDLYGGGDLDYNDVVFRIEGHLVEQL